MLQFNAMRSSAYIIGIFCLCTPFLVFDPFAQDPAAVKPPLSVCTAAILLYALSPGYARREASSTAVATAAISFPLLSAALRGTLQAPSLTATTCANILWLECGMRMQSGMTRRAIPWVVLLGASANLLLYAWSGLEWSRASWPAEHLPTEGALVGTMANPNYTASWLLVWTVFLMFLNRREGKDAEAGGRPSVAAAALLASCAVILVSSNRMAWLVLAAAWGLRFAAARSSGKRRKLVVPLLGGLLLGGVMLLCAGEGSVPAKLGNLSSLRQRLIIWKDCLLAGREKPWFGWGCGNFLAAYTSLYDPDHAQAGLEPVCHFAHNLPLQFLVEGGAAGLALFGLLAGLLLGGARPVADRRSGRSVSCAHEEAYASRAALTAALAYGMAGVGPVIPFIQNTLAFLAGIVLRPVVREARRTGTTVPAGGGGMRRLLRIVSIALLVLIGIKSGLDGWMNERVRYALRYGALHPHSLEDGLRMLSSPSPRHIYDLAGRLALDGRLHEALKGYLLCERLLPDFDLCAYNEAVIYEALGLHEKARRTYRRAVLKGKLPGSFCRYSR